MATTNMDWLRHFKVDDMREIAKHPDFHALCDDIREHNNGEQIIAYQVTGGQLILHSKLANFHYVKPGGPCMITKAIWPTEEMRDLRPIIPPVLGEDGIFAIRPHPRPGYEHIWIVARDLAVDKFVVHLYNGCQGCVGYSSGIYTDTKEECLYSFIHRVV
jgi:hypothetical protein